MVGWERSGTVEMKGKEAGACDVVVGQGGREVGRSGVIFT